MPEAAQTIQCESEISGFGNVQERRWLDRANAVDPHNFVARAAYMSAIETRWGGSHEMMQAFLEECRGAGPPEDQMQILESVVAEDEGWIHQFVDYDYAAAEAAYRKSGALGGDKQLVNLAFVLIAQNKYREALEPLTEELRLRPDDFAALTDRGNAYIQLGMMREGSKICSMQFSYLAIILSIDRKQRLTRHWTPSTRVFGGRPAIGWCLK